MERWFSSTCDLQVPRRRSKGVLSHLLLCCLQMEILETSLFYFLLANQSKFSMEVTFELTGRGNLLQHLRAEPPSARADVGAHLRTSLSFSPKGVCHLQDVKLRIKVREAGSSQVLCTFYRLAKTQTQFLSSRLNWDQRLTLSSKADPQLHIWNSPSPGTTLANACCTAPAWWSPPPPS